ncbi:MAG: hypothetical protein COA45_05315 [Zetaproteobacteria bacterium]|nr:MAG: hypothetical protein COA45_05315 [Zetaproteobacteria bacterium]
MGHSTLSSIFFHAAILIPIEWGILHATPIGPMLTEVFSEIFEHLGFEFSAHEHTTDPFDFHGNHVNI